MYSLCRGADPRLRSGNAHGFTSPEAADFPQTRGSSPRAEGRSASLRFQRVAHLVLALTLLGVVCVRLHRLDVPFERDEGEFAYMGQLILQGIPPFETAYNMKLPGTYYAYAAIMSVGGESVEAVHFGLLLINLAAIALVYVLGRRLLGPSEAALSALAYALFSLEPTVLGFFAHATHFVIAPALAGLLLLLRALDEQRRGLLFASGLLLGVAFLMKQHGIAFVALGSITLCWRLASAKLGSRTLAASLLAFGAGAALPLALTCLYLLWEGVFPTFWHWTFEYARQYVTVLTLREAVIRFSSSLGPIVWATWPLWLCAGAGAGEIAFCTERRAIRAFLAGLVLFSFLAVVPGFYFRPHYFILLLPAVSLLAGVGLVRIARVAAPLLRTPAPVVLLAIVGTILAAGAYRRAPALFYYSADRVSHVIYGKEFFPEYREIGNFLSERSDPNDTIAVIGSEPEIYFYAKRRSASGYLYTYPMMEPQPFARDMQRQMAAQIEGAQPRYVVFMNVGDSWARQQDSDPFIFEWAKIFLLAYRPIALYELRIDGRSRFLPGEGSHGHRAPWALLYERRPDPASPEAP